jgi:hypothetical protein
VQLKLKSAIKIQSVNLNKEVSLSSVFVQVLELTSTRLGGHYAIEERASGLLRQADV